MNGLPRTAVAPDRKAINVESPRGNDSSSTMASLGRLADSMRNRASCED